MTLVKLSYVSKKFSLLLFKCIFKALLNGFCDLEPMTHVVYIFAEYQTGAIAGHCFEAVM